MRKIKRIGVIAIEDTASMSENDILDLNELLTLLEKKYHFRWSRTHNPKWVRALADQMEEVEK